MKQRYLILDGNTKAGSRQFQISPKQNYTGYI